MATSAKLLQTDVGLAPRAARWRIGLIALATDHTAERDFTLLRAHEDLAIYVNRVAFQNPMTKENLMAMQSLLTAAADLILPGESLDALAYGCTSASALIGDAAVREAIQAAKPGVPVITPASAALAAFSFLRCKRISVLAPYSAVVTEGVVNYFESSGVSVVSAACLGLADDRETARVALDSILAAAIEACDPSAEALFISCTALRAMSVLQRIEDRLGRPVISSNQAMLWDSIRQAGCNIKIAGYGRLLQ